MKTKSKFSSKGVARIVDANLNRSKEGLRVCEEVARYIIGSKSLTRRFKHSRHVIAKISQKIDRVDPGLLISRDSMRDVGSDSNIRNNFYRSGFQDVFYANIQRVKESIRVLEEFLKLIDVNISRECSALRYKIYELEKDTCRFIKL